MLIIFNENGDREMPKKYYAVKTGRKTGVFLTWEQCRMQVDGFPSAAYKSFPTREQAEEFLLIGTPKIGEASIPEAGEWDTATAYVDGCYRHDTRYFACGAILF
ncbi:MAG: RNase H1/viroplasmin domain-containing protein [Oscillospiraceae bacterium]